MKITKRQLRRIIREAIQSEALPTKKPKRILSTDPKSTKIYMVRYPDDVVGKYAGHEATGGNDPEVQSAAAKTGVEIKPGRRGRNFEVIGNKFSLSNFDKEYRAATKPIRDAITRQYGSHMDRWRQVVAARRASDDWRAMERKQMKDWRSGKTNEVPLYALSDAYSEAELADSPPPNLKYAKLLKTR